MSTVDEHLAEPIDKAIAVAVRSMVDDEIKKAVDEATESLQKSIARRGGEIAIDIKRNLDTRMIDNRLTICMYVEAK